MADIDSTADLINAGLAPASARPDLDRVAEKYAIAISPTIRRLIEAPDDPIGRQFIPDPAELLTTRCRR
jgi:lysine 2,3-aminomutase